MTDLFESLSIRFAHDANPAIRPRPQSRFEDVSGIDSITEEDSYETALAPSGTQEPPPTLPDDNDPKMHPGPVAVDRPIHDPVGHHAHHHADPPLPQEANQNSDPAPVAAVDKTLASQQILQHNAPEVSPDTSRTEKLGKTEDHPEHLVAKTNDGPEVIREVAPSNSGEQPENALHRIETRVVQALAEPHEQSALPNTSQPNTTIRIGRIEMRQPAPPPPAPAPPPRRTPPSGSSAMSQGSGRDNSGSGLTDYLGWKRR